MNLLAHYKLSDASDASGNGRHGVAANVSYVAGKLGMAGSFNGSTSLVDCQSDFIGTSACTISAWIFLNGWGEESSPGSGGFGRIVENGKTICYCTDQTGNPAGTYNLRLSSNGGTTTASSATNSISLGQWIHVAVTRTAAGVANLYVNGALSGTANQASGTPAAGTTNVILGNNLATTRALAGLLDDVRIYDEVLTAEKILAIARDRRGRPYPWQQTIIQPTIQSTLL
jgi:hypothetical protein